MRPGIKQPERNASSSLNAEVICVGCEAVGIYSGFAWIWRTSTPHETMTTLAWLGGARGGRQRTDRCVQSGPSAP